MRIRVSQPDPEYPFAWVIVENGAENNTELPGILANRRMTLLGGWEPYLVHGIPMYQVKAPVLLEDEHIKPKKRAVKK